MTIALGMVGTDGMVVAADTLASYGSPGALHGSITKIGRYLTVNAPGAARGVLIAGAGDDVRHMSGLMERLGTAYLRLPWERFPTLTETYEQVLHEYQNQHFPDPDKRPVLEFILAGAFTPLLRTADTSVVRASPHVAIGAGEQLANQLLARWWQDRPVAELQWLAAWIVYLVKRDVEGCGKETHVDVLHAHMPVTQPDGSSRLVPPDPLISSLSWPQVKAFEEMAERRYRRQEFQAVWKLIDRATKQSDPPRPTRGRSVQPPSPE